MTQEQMTDAMQSEHESVGITVHTDRSLAELQRLVGNWSDYNFGANRETLAYRSLYGIIEEFGELVHSQLKMEQNIRGTKEEHMAKIRDAIGDIVFYAMDYLHMMNIEVDFDWPMDNHVGDGTTFDTLAIVIDDINRLVHAHRFPKVYHDTKWLVNLVLMHLGLFCSRHNINMKEVVWDTALSVFGRDWIKFPKNGRTE